MDYGTTIIWSPGMTLAMLEKQGILIAFRVFRGNRSQTAKALDISVRTLDAKLAEYKVIADDNDQKEKEFQERQYEQLRKARGEHTPNYTFNGDDERHARDERNAAASAKSAIAKNAKESGTSSADRVHVEPTPIASAKSEVPVSERQKIQSVLPESNPKSGHAGRR